MPPRNPKIDLPSLEGGPREIYPSEEGGISDSARMMAARIKERHANLSLPDEDESLTDRIKAAFRRDDVVQVVEEKKGPLHPDVLNLDAKVFTGQHLKEQQSRFDEVYFHSLKQDAEHIRRCVQKIPALIEAIEQQPSSTGPNIRLSRMQAHLHLNALGLNDEFLKFLDRFNDLVDIFISQLKDRGFHYLKDVTRRDGTQQFDELSIGHDIDAIVQHARMARITLQEAEKRYPYFKKVMVDTEEHASSQVHGFKLLIEEMNAAVANRNTEPAHLAIIYLRLCKQLLAFIDKTIARSVTATQIDKFKQRKADPLLEVSTTTDAAANVLLAQLMSKGLLVFAKDQTKKPT